MLGSMSFFLVKADNREDVCLRKVFERLCGWGTEGRPLSALSRAACEDICY